MNSGANILASGFDMKTKKNNFMCRSQKFLMLTLQEVMQKQFLYHIISLIFLLLLVPGLACAESARSLVESGNEAFSKGDFPASLTNYEKAADLEPDSAVVLFNMGDALYKQQKYDEALNVFEQAAARAMEKNDPMLEAQSRYNMGNSAYRRAEMYSRADLQKAFEEYKRSSGYYQSAVKLNPGLSEAAHNLEASRIAAKQLEELLHKQQQEAREQAQQRQDMAKDLENLQKEQQKAAEQSRDLAQNQQQESKNNNAAMQAENQESITERTRETGEKLEQLNKEHAFAPSNEIAREHVKRALEQQEEAQKNLQENKISAAHENQQEAARELQKALQQLDQSQDKGEKKELPGRKEEKEKAETEQQKPLEQQAAEGEAGQENYEAPPVSGAPDNVSPEDIINEELENRKFRSTRGTTGYEPVDRDW